MECCTIHSGRSKDHGHGAVFFLYFLSNNESLEMCFVDANNITQELISINCMYMCIMYTKIIWELED